MDRVLTLTSRIKLRIVDLFNTYPPFLATIPLKQGMTWCPTWKALPTHRVTLSVWVNRMKLPYGRVRGLKSSFTELLVSTPLVLT